jgi:F-type H+-transporting ATPase subunit epsilon
VEALVALQIDIVTPERVVFSGQADVVSAPGWLGEFSVLPDHALFLSLLRAGVVSVTTGQGTKRFVVGRGFAEVGPDRVVLLTDLAEPADKADRAGAQKLLESAERVMADSEPGTAEREAAERDAELAQARLSV